MINVYIQKWNKEDAPWQRILTDILKKDYKIEKCPEILRDDMGKPYFADCALHFNVSHYYSITNFTKTTANDMIIPYQILGYK